MEITTEGNLATMDQEKLFVSQQTLDPEDTVDHDVVDLQSVQATKVQGERLLEESRTLTTSSRALLNEIDPSAI